MKNSELLGALVFEPRKAFTELDARPRYALPLLLLALASAALSVWYVSKVDMVWLTDLQLRNSSLTQNLTDAEIERMANAAGGRRGVQMVFGGLGTFAGVLIIMFLSGLYYLLASKLTGVRRSYTHWMTLAAWSSLPGMLGVILGAVMLATATSTQIGQETLQPLSLNSLLFHRVPGDPGYTLLSSLSLLQLVSVWLAAFGLKVWSGRSWLFSIVFTALPLVLVYGCWAFFALRQS